MYCRNESYTQVIHLINIKKSVLTTNLILKLCLLDMQTWVVKVEKGCYLDSFLSGENGFESYKKFFFLIFGRNNKIFINNEPRQSLCDADMFLPNPTNQNVDNLQPSACGSSTITRGFQCTRVTTDQG